jgi:hypothetical protein
VVVSKLGLNVLLQWLGLDLIVQRGIFLHKINKINGHSKR